MVRGIRLITCAILLTFNVQTRALEPANPGLMAEEGPKWLYCLPWWVGGKHNPEDWVKKTYIHPRMVTRDWYVLWRAMTGYSSELLRGGPRRNRSSRITATAA